MKRIDMNSYLKKNLVVLIALLFILPLSYAVNTFATSTGSISNSTTSGPCDGYTLICPGNGTVFLIDMNETVIHTWSLHGFPAKMLPGGSIIGDLDANDLDEYKYIAQEDWQGNIVWEFHNYSDGLARQHHDFEREGNPVGYYAPGQDFVENGTTLVLARITLINRSINLLMPLDDDVIYEVDWQGNLTGFVWHANEHYKEMGFSIWARLGILHQVMPYLFRTTYQGWLHINTISELGENHWYNEGDSRFNPRNIILDSRQASFIVIIDRVTGDIVWRVGPDYSKNTEAGKKLGPIIGMHNAHMIPEGLPGAGNILVFDNGGYAGYGLLGQPIKYLRFYSRVLEFNPVTLDLVWEYVKKDTPRFYSDRISGAQRLPNGNTLICEGSTGRVFEVTQNDSIVWQYIYPGPSGNFTSNDVYRAYRIPPEWVPGNPSGYDPWE
jgi:hypothetical protein